MGYIDDILIFTLSPECPFKTMLDLKYVKDQPKDSVDYCQAQFPIPISVQLELRLVLFSVDPHS